jgi:hypothetical protein
MDAIGELTMKYVTIPIQSLQPYRELLNKVEDMVPTFCNFVVSTEITGFPPRMRREIAERTTFRPCATEMKYLLRLVKVQKEDRIAFTQQDWTTIAAEIKLQEKYFTKKNTGIPIGQPIRL